MAIQIDRWLTGDIAPIGAQTFIMMVTTDGPGTLQFSVVSGYSPINLPTSPVPIIQTSQGYIAQAVVSIAGTVTDGDTSVLSATPIDEGGNNGTAVDQTITYHEYRQDAGLTLIAPNGNFVMTPADVQTMDKYWVVAMDAFDTANKGLTGAMVAFSFAPDANIQVFTNDVPPVKVNPIAGDYYAKTDVAGRASLRVVTNTGTLIQHISSQGTMRGVELSRPNECYFAKNIDDNDVLGWWKSPTAVVDDNNNIYIPPTGDTFKLNVSVNGEDDSSFTRFVIMNNSLAILYPNTTDGFLEIEYSILNQNTSAFANTFTYARQTSTGNVNCSLPWDCGVDGNPRANLPDPTKPNRVAPAPVVVPSPGGTEWKINRNTINEYQCLRLSLQNFPAATLVGLNPSAALTVIFQYYMNGYLFNGDIRQSYIYRSDRPQDQIIAPTITNNAGTIEFSDLYADLSLGHATGWGRNKYTNEVKKVGFEYIISDGTTTWYSEYSSDNSWYLIDTGYW